MSISDSVFHSRAVRASGYAIEDDPEPMVHQQLARLLFLSQLVEVRGKRILEFGCGTGLNCAFLQNKDSGAKEVLGFDISEDSVVLAQQNHPGVHVFCADACDLALNVSPGTWDLIVSFEVLEHVPDMTAFLKNIRRHLAEGGTAFISTPNRDVFSLGFEPSPVNREHIKELSVDELRVLLGQFFSVVELWGQKFTRPELQARWNEDVRAKINRVQDGTRWAQTPSATSRLKNNALVSRAYQNESLRRTWKYLRWGLWHRLEQRQQVSRRPYSYKDFEFSKEMANALWSCAIVKA
jgi:SAM-dependent methyltransferase